MRVSSCQRGFAACIALHLALGGTAWNAVRRSDIFGAPYASEQGAGISSDALVAVTLAAGRATVRWNGESYRVAQVTQVGLVARIYWSRFPVPSGTLSGLPVTLITSDKEAALFCVAATSPKGLRDLIVRLAAEDPREVKGLLRFVCACWVCQVCVAIP
jgi:hypothetical protein